MPYVPNLAHFRHASGVGNPGWGQTQNVGLAGQSPTVSTYDADFGASHSNLNTSIHGGVYTERIPIPASDPTMTRTGTVSAQQNSLPASRFFNMFGNASGTGHSWAGGAVANVPRITHQDFNRNMQGAAELHPSTTYDPYPSPSAYYPKVV